ncbi:MAG TPA: hypothetical protein PL185_05190 [Flavobacteriales bacterium]|nr:hypothetical protein [Flavobacteriales bacterium]
MQQSKLIQLLKSLSKKEFKEFQGYVSSEFFNKNQQLVRLLDHLSNYQGYFDTSKVDKEVFIPKHYPNENLEEQKFRYLQSDLTKLLEDFIAYTQYSKDSFQRRYFLLEALNQRNQDKYFLQELDAIKELNDNSPFRDSQYYFNQHKISELSYQHTSEKRNRAFDSSLQEVIDNLEITYLARGFRYYCEMINRRNILSVEYNLSFFDEMVQYLNNATFDFVPAIRIYRLIHKALTEPDNQQNYTELLRSLDEHCNLFSKPEQRGMYVFAQNYCIKRINRGEAGALKQIFDLYQAMVDKDLIYEGNYVSQPDFKNIVTTGLRLGEVEWVSGFIEEFKGKLNPEFSENAYTYSMAWVHFTRREFDKALRMLLRVEFNDVYYHLDSKSLLMKVYYEMDEYDAFFSLVDAFKIYLRRNKFISEFQRETYHNFILLINKLMKVKLRKNSMTAVLHEEVCSTKPAADLIWLKTKSEELMKMSKLM